MVSNEQKEGWRYIAVKELATQLRGIVSKHHVDCYCLNCLHFFATISWKCLKKEALSEIVFPTQKYIY